ncbi:MAG TPA: hypothetical protein VF605_19620 [Allosphingosinicella sp.]
MPRARKKKWTHNWAAYGVLVAAAGAIIAFLTWLNPSSTPTGDVIYSDRHSNQIVENVAAEAANVAAPEELPRANLESQAQLPAASQPAREKNTPPRAKEGTPQVQIGDVTSINQTGGVTAGQIGNVTMGPNQ